MINKIKEALKNNEDLYNFFSELYKKFKFRKLINKRRRFYNAKKKNRNIYFLLDQEHGNLGDQAIGYTEQKFVKEKLNNYNVISILEDEYKLFKKNFEKEIKKSDIIALRGGGSIGNEYIAHEISRRDIIERFPNNKIISFPQTIYFSNDDNGNIELEKSIKIYKNHNNLNIIAREQISFNLMKKYFNNNNIILTPDIVLYLNKTDKKSIRDGALYCFRSDNEGILSNGEKKIIKNIIKNNFDKVEITDMCVQKKITINDREKELNDKLKQFRSSELVITDRLHGMVFSAITSTPCIVFSNYNHKVSGTYEWIKNLPYIRFVDNIDELEETINYIRTLKNYKYSNENLINYYEKIIKLIID